MTDDDLQRLLPWLERRHTSQFTPDPAPAALLAATLDLPAPSLEHGAPLPPMWQVVYGHEPVPSADLGDDGAPLRTGASSSPLMPPIPLPQVMWAGADYRFAAPLRIGVPVHRSSRIDSMTLKHGRRGPMLFISWLHEWQQRGQTAVHEVYRAVYLGADGPDAAPAGAGAAVGPVAERHLDWPMSEVRLFRYSALTFNAHRIHYDLPYATGVAGYPGLVVHGPLQALLIAETWRRWHPDQPLGQVSIQARAPLFGLGGVRVASDSAAPNEQGEQTLWSCTADGRPALRATLQALAPAPA